VSPLPGLPARAWCLGIAAFFQVSMQARAGSRVTGRQRFGVTEGSPRQPFGNTYFYQPAMLARLGISTPSTELSGLSDSLRIFINREAGVLRLAQDCRVRPPMPAMKKQIQFALGERELNGRRVARAGHISSLILWQEAATHRTLRVWCSRPGPGRAPAYSSAPSSAIRRTLAEPVRGALD